MKKRQFRNHIKAALELAIKKALKDQRLKVANLNESDTFTVIDTVRDVADEITDTINDDMLLKAGRLILI